MADDPSRWTIAEARDSISRGAISVREYVDTLIDQAERARYLNAFVYQHMSAMRGYADALDGRHAGPSILHGIPFVLKDNIDTWDAPTAAGTGALAGRVPPSDAPVVRRMREAGAILAGKCTMHELSFGITSNNAVTGAARNPYDSTLIPGGSSGGTAVAVAAGIAPAGLGADTGGSVRLPAALCGVVGFRPTLGRYSGQGVIPVAHSRDTVGPMARSVADVRLLDALLANTPNSSATARLGTTLIGVSVNFYRDLEPAVNAVSTTVLDLLAEAAVELVDVDIESIAEQGKDASMIIAMHEFPRDMMAYLRASGYDLALVDIGAGIGSPDVRASFEAITGAERPTDEQYRTALSLRDEARQRYARLVADRRLSAPIQPTAPLTARPIGHDDTVELNGRQVPTFPTFVRHTDLAGTIGLPGISLPAGLAPSGLPVGIELGAAAGQDSTLLALAAAVERILPSTEPPQLESGLRPHVGACAAASDT